MTAVMGSTEAAMAVAKPAMERVARSPYVSAVPGGFAARFGSCSTIEPCIPCEATQQLGCYKLLGCLLLPFCQRQVLIAIFGGLEEACLQLASMFQPEKQSRDK